MEKYNQIHIQKLSTSSVKERYLLISKEKYYEVSPSVVQLLVCLQEKDTQEEAIDAYIGQRKSSLSLEQIEEVIDQCIAPILESGVKKKRSFIYEKELFSATTIDRFSDFFSFLFYKKLMIPFMIVALCLDIYFFLATENLLVINNSINAYAIVVLLIFMLFSSLLHEVGHASACKYFGIKHGQIGFGLYLNFPVLYTEVTDVWRLQRWKRCVVNIAGVYFQMYLLFFLLLFFLLTGSDIIRYMLLLINFGFILTLNPFFKFDGYWITSDILGIPNLRKRSQELLLYYFKSTGKRSRLEKPYILQVNRLGRYGIIIYSIVVNLFMGYYLFYILPKFVISFIHSFPDEIKQLALYLSNNMTPSFALLRNLIMQLLLLALLGVFVFNIVRGLLKYARKK